MYFRNFISEILFQKSYFVSRNVFQNVFHEFIKKKNSEKFSRNPELTLKKYKIIILKIVGLQVQNWGVQVVMASQ